MASALVTVAMMAVARPERCRRRRALRSESIVVLAHRGAAQQARCRHRVDRHRTETLARGKLNRQMTESPR